MSYFHQDLERCQKCGRVLPEITLWFVYPKTGGKGYFLCDACGGYEEWSRAGAAKEA